MADNYIERQYEEYEARKAAWEKTRKYSKKTAVKTAVKATAPKRETEQPTGGEPEIKDQDKEEGRYVE